MLFELIFRFAGSYHLITNSPTKSILSNSQHSTPQRTIGSDHPLNQQQSKLPMGSPNKAYMMLPYRKINDSPTHQLIQIQHSNLDNYCCKYLLGNSLQYWSYTLSDSISIADGFLSHSPPPFTQHFPNFLIIFESFFYRCKKEVFCCSLKKSQNFLTRCAFLINFTSLFYILILLLSAVTFSII